MRIASVIDVSLVDVPGIPVSVVFTGGCNFDCPYCQNAQLIPESSGTDMPIRAIIAKTEGSLSGGCCITGGEPTIHRDLPQLLKELRRKRDYHLNLNTQGSRPDVLKHCLPYLNSVWFDIKTDPTRYREVVRTPYDPWSKVRESIDLVMHSDAAFWPRTTYAGNLMSTHDIQAILRFLGEIGFRGDYVVQKYLASAGTRKTEVAKLRMPTRDELEPLTRDTPPGIKMRLELFDLERGQRTG
jgi:pyruvate formate lyase activating enzyme